MKINTREQIVSAALKLFYQQGFHATGVEQLANNAGVTKRTLYSYFPSKDDLILAALNLRHEEFIAQLRAALDQRPATEIIAAYADFLLQWSLQANYHGCAFINACAEYGDHQNAAHQLAAQHKEQVHDLLRERLVLADAKTPAVAAETLFLLGEGYIVASQVSGAARQQSALLQALTILAKACGL